MVYLSVMNFEEIENSYGWQASDRLLQRLGRHLLEVVRKVCPSGILSRSDVFREEFLLLLPETPDGGEVKVETIEHAALDIEGHLQDRILEEGVGMPDGRVELRSGYSMLRESPFVRFERMVLKGIDEAREMSVHQEERDRLRQRSARPPA